MDCFVKSQEQLNVGAVCTKKKKKKKESQNIYGVSIETTRGTVENAIWDVGRYCTVGWTVARRR